MATIEKKDGVIIIRDFDLTKKKTDDKTKKISETTANTWQKERSEEEKLADTSLGKIAENLFENYIQQFDIIYQSYDSFRANNFEKHAPFDGLLFNAQKKKLADDFIKKINTEITATNYGKISTSLLSDLSNSKIYTTEIKSTRLIDRHKTNGEYDIAKIKQDDFLTYPHDLRSTDVYYNLETYKEFLIEKGILPAGSTISNFKNYELQFMMDLYVRVYIDEKNKLGYIMGYITKDKYIERVTIKKMYQRGKSEKALYLATTISNGLCVDELSNYLKN